MNRVIGPAEMMPNIMNLGMTVVTAGDTVIGPCLDNLIKFKFAVSPPLLLKTRLEKAAAATAAIIIGSVRGHLDDVFLADNLFHHITQILGNSLAITFSDDLAGILNGKFDLTLLVPVGVDLQASLANPLGVILVD